MMRVAAMPQSVSFWPAHPTRPYRGVKEERGICSARERGLGLLTCAKSQEHRISITK